MSMSTPVWMDWLFDHTGSYYWFLIPLAPTRARHTTCDWVV